MSELVFIPWNPDSNIIDLGFLAIKWYSLFFGLGMVLSYALLKRLFAKEQIPLWKLDKLTIYAVLGTLIGARLGHVLFYDLNYYSRHILEIFLPVTFDPSFKFTGFEGLASHGGAVGILIALFLYSRKYKQGLLWLFDKIALVVPLAGVFIRIGNLMNSEIIGTPTTVPWAFVFQKVDQLPRHPAQLYEAIVYLAIFFILQALSRQKFHPDGRIFGWFLILIFAARFAIEFFKADQVPFEAGMALNMGQILSIPFILAGLFILVRSYRRTTSR